MLYMKGPDVWSKSRRTYYCYRHLLVNQARLGDYGFHIIEPDPIIEKDSLGVLAAVNKLSDYDLSRSVSPLGAPPSSIGESDVHSEGLVPDSIDSKHEGSFLREGSHPFTRSQKRKLFEASSDESDHEEVAEVDAELDEGELENGWEEEIRAEAGLRKGSTDVHSWDDLREQIKDDLKKHAKSPLSLAQINQLMILRNFATLCIKGFTCTEASFEIALNWHEGNGDASVYFARRVRALARHYQIYEQLPREQRGGSNDSGCCSLLKDEIVCSSVWSWLNEQPVGSITPSRLQDALCDIILPGLG